MTLEVLFAQQGQSAAFLQWCVLGLIAGLLLHTSVGVHRRWRRLGALLDVVCCLGVTAAAVLVLARSGAGVRLYGLLGLVIGLVLYAAGVYQAARWLWQLTARRKSAVPLKNKDTGS